MEALIDEYAVACMDGSMDGCRDGWMYGYLDEMMDRRLEAGVIAWMN